MIKTMKLRSRSFRFDFLFGVGVLGEVVGGGSGRGREEFHF